MLTLGEGPKLECYGTGYERGFIEKFVVLSWIQHYVCQVSSKNIYSKTKRLQNDCQTRVVLSI